MGKVAVLTRAVEQRTRRVRALCKAVSEIHRLASRQAFCFHRDMTAKSGAGIPDFGSACSRTTKEMLPSTESVAAGWVALGAPPTLRGLLLLRAPARGLRAACTVASQASWGHGKEGAVVVSGRGRGQSRGYTRRTVHSTARLPCASCSHRGPDRPPLWP